MQGKWLTLNAQMFEDMADAEETRTSELFGRTQLEISSYAMLKMQIADYAQR